MSPRHRLDIREMLVAHHFRGPSSSEAHHFRGPTPSGAHHFMRPQLRWLVFYAKSKKAQIAVKTAFARGPEEVSICL